MVIQLTLIEIHTSIRCRHHFIKFTNMNKVSTNSCLGNQTKQYACNLNILTLRESIFYKNPTSHNLFRLLQKQTLIELSQNISKR